MSEFPRSAGPDTSGYESFQGLSAEQWDLADTIMKTILRENLIRHRRERESQDDSGPTAFDVTKEEEKQ